MAKSNFTRVLAEVFKHEGGYADHPRDPGGATNMGITHITLADWRGVPSVTKQEVRDLTRDEAAAIYRARYWNPIKGDALPYGFDLLTMDGAVNSGARRGVRWLQKGVGAAPDGKVGPKTIEAARAGGQEAIQRACAARMGFLQGLRHWETFGRGWSRRVADVEAVSVRMCVAATSGVPAARTALSDAARRAPDKAKAARGAGKAQAGATATGGAGGVSVADMPLAAAVTLALGVMVVAALLIWRAQRRGRYHEDRLAAYAAALEEIGK